MRIVGIALILIGLPLIGWFGYVELYYLGEVESGFEEQRIKSEEAIISKIKETKDKFNTMKANLKKSNASKKKIAQVDAQLNDLLGGLHENYKTQEKAMNEYSSLQSPQLEMKFHSWVGYCGYYNDFNWRDDNWVPLLCKQRILWQLKEDYANTEDDKETSIEEYLNSAKIATGKTVKGKSE